MTRASLQQIAEMADADWRWHGLTAEWRSLFVIVDGVVWRDEDA